MKRTDLWFNHYTIYIKLSMVFTRIRVQLGCYITVINQCYSLLSRIAITRRFASPMALLLGFGPEATTLDPARPQVADRGTAPRYGG